MKKNQIYTFLKYPDFLNLQSHPKIMDLKYSIYKINVCLVFFVLSNFLLMNVPLFFAECQDHYVTFYVNGSIGRGKEKLLYRLEV